MTVLLFQFNLDFSGLIASVCGYFMLQIGFICLLSAFITGMVMRHKRKVPVFKQKSGAFIIGGSILMFFGALLMLSVWDDYADREFRKTMDSVAFFYVVLVLVLTIFVVMMRLGKVQKYPEEQIKKP